MLCYAMCVKARINTHTVRHLYTDTFQFGFFPNIKKKLAAIPIASQHTVFVCTETASYTIQSFLNASLQHWPMQLVGVLYISYSRMISLALMCVSIQGLQMCTYKTVHCPRFSNIIKIVGAENATVFCRFSLLINVHSQSNQTAVTYFFCNKYFIEFSFTLRLFSVNIEFVSSHDLNSN